MQLPEGILSLPPGSMAGLDSLEYIKIPSTCIELGGGAYSYSSKLKRIIMPETVKIYDWTVLSYVIGSPVLDEIDVFVTNVPNGMIQNTCVATKLNLKNTVTIERRAFLGLKNVTEITLPSTVKSIGDWAFNSALQVIKFNGTITQFKEISYEAQEGIRVICNNGETVTKVNNIYIYKYKRKRLVFKN